MKLATLAAYIWSGWPRGVTTIEQTHTGHIVGTYTTGNKKMMRNDPLPLCEDWSSVVVTQYVYDQHVAASMRQEPGPGTQFFPVIACEEELALILASPGFKSAWADYLTMQEEPDAKLLVAEIAHLREMVHTILTVHLTTVRARKKAARASVAAEKSLVWLLAQMVGAWPGVSFGGTTLYARYVTQDKDGNIKANYEWEGKIIPWDIPNLPKEFTWKADDWYDANTGDLRKVTRDQWELAVRARSAKSAARAQLLEESFKQNSDPDAMVDTSNVEGLLAHGRKIHELAQGAQGLVEDDAKLTARRSNPQLKKNAYNKSEADPREGLSGENKYEE